MLFACPYAFCMNKSFSMPLSFALSIITQPNLLDKKPRLTERADLPNSPA
jgi:hypothetical protein